MTRLREPDCQMHQFVSRHQEMVRLFQGHQINPPETEDQNVIYLQSVATPVNRIVWIPLLD